MIQAATLTEQNGQVIQFTRHAVGLIGHQAIPMGLQGSPNTIAHVLSILFKNFYIGEMNHMYISVTVFFLLSSFFSLIK